MESESSERGGYRGLVFTALALFVLFGALTVALVSGGCGSPPDYPSTLSFPSRADRLVLKLPETPPPGPNNPAEREESIARLDTAGGKTVDPSRTPHEVSLALNRFLKDSFGTPSAPKIAGDPEVTAAAERLGLTPDKLAEAGRLFRHQCQQCHNLAGDGRGPASLVTPFPRDFRRGEFKFISTGVSPPRRGEFVLTGMSKPRRADILRTLAEGLKGTAMPSFSLLPEENRDLLARYVAYLSIRGEVEYQTLAAALGGSSELGDVGSFAAAQLRSIIADWEKAESSPAPVGIAPEPDDAEPASSPAHAEAVRRGYKLFTAKADNSCITCHAEFGRKPVLRYDVWGTVAKPADFTATTLKGGKRPEDVFARIRGGIAPVGMPAHPELTDRQVWDLVRFVRSLPYPRELPEDVRAAVYPNP
jgi:mono/diheme cytochrome c family protein